MRLIKTTLSNRATVKPCDSMSINVSMAFPALLILLSVVSRAGSMNTFVSQDPVTGVNITCDMCPPGEYMTAQCTTNTQTQCAPCREQHFTELWNYLPRCLYCNIFCIENQEVEIECSATTNRVCRCKAGFYWADEFCRTHTECDPGTGVKTAGTPHSDTVCELCPDGFFSNLTSAVEPCVRQQECASGQLELLTSSFYPTVCGTCEDLARGGETLRSFLSGLISMHRPRVSKLRKFVKSYITKSPSRDRDELIQQIRDWVNQASPKDLNNLPRMLRSSQLRSIVETLETTVREINEKSPGCSLML